MLFMVGWHNIDSAYNFKRMNLFLEEKSLLYEIKDSGLLFINTSEQGHMSGMVLMFISFFGLVTSIIIDDILKKEKLSKIK